jgi:hypothetical protein
LWERALADAEASLDFERAQIRADQAEAEASVLRAQEESSRAEVVAARPEAQLEVMRVEVRVIESRLAFALARQRQLEDDNERLKSALAAQTTELDAAWAEFFVELGRMRAANAEVARLEASERRVRMDLDRERKATTAARRETERLRSNTRTATKLLFGSAPPPA